MPKRRALGPALLASLLMSAPGLAAPAPAACMPGSPAAGSPPTPSPPDASATEVEADGASREQNSEEPFDWWLTGGLGAIGRPGEGYLGGEVALTLARDAFQGRLKGSLYREFQLCLDFNLFGTGSGRSEERPSDERCGPRSSAGELGILGGVRATNERWFSASVNAGPGLLVLDDVGGPALLLEADVMVGWRIVGVGLVGLADLSSVGLVTGAMLTLNLGKPF